VHFFGAKKIDQDFIEAQAFRFLAEEFYESIVNLPEEDFSIVRNNL
jgi:hypothetical protein